VDREEDLDDAGMLAHPVDLTGGNDRLLARHDDRGAQARLALEPLGGEPVVDRPGDRQVAVRVVDALDGVGAVEDRGRRAPGVERLLAQPIEARPGRSAAGRRGVGTGRGRRPRVGRVVRALEPRLADVLAPEIGQPWEERLDRWDDRVDVAVDDVAQRASAASTSVTWLDLSTACAGMIAVRPPVSNPVCCLFSRQRMDAYYTVR
jgi:hypothetical protein